MLLRDLHDNLEFRPAIPPVVVSDNTAQVSSIIDLANVTVLEFAIATGAIVDADATFQVLVEDGNTPTLTDAQAVGPSCLLGVPGVAATPTGASFRFDSDNQTRKIGYIGANRFVRLTVTPANNSGSATLSAIAILSGHKKSIGPSQAG